MRTNRKKFPAIPFELILHDRSLSRLHLARCTILQHVLFFRHRFYESSERTYVREETPPGGRERSVTFQVY